MAKLIVALFTLVAVRGVASDWCYSYTYNLRRETYCTYGCCYKNSDLCCDAPYYSKPTFIAPLTVGCCFVLAIIITALRICLAHNSRRVTVQYRTRMPVAAPESAVATPGSTQYGGYSNNQPQPPPPYTAELPKY